MRLFPFAHQSLLSITKGKGVKDNLLIYDNTQINTLFGNTKKERESMFV